jgi:penicillin G amidase
VDWVPVEPAYALRWTAGDGLIEPSMLVEIANADGFEAFREALRGIACPGQNVVYADVDGTIGYQLTGLYPVRRAGDGTVPVPGWTSEHEWEGFVPFDRLPWSKDPERGYLVTANNRTHDESYPHLIGRDFHTPHRARRIADRLESEHELTAERMAKIQMDTVSLPARALLPRLTALDPRDDDEAWALDLLRSWDGAERAGSAAAAIYNVWLWSIARRLLRADDDRTTFDRYHAWREPFVCAALPSLLESDVPDWVGIRENWDEVLHRSLAGALAMLAERLGPDRSAWRWGALHRVGFAHVLARMPALAPVLVAAEYELGGDEQTILQAGFDARDGFDAAVVPSWRVVVDLADVDRSMAVLPTGQSGNPASPHWNDQAPLWIEGSLRQAPVGREAVEAAAVRTLKLLPPE